MSKNLTDRQKEILKFIYDHIEAEGYPPTLREIGSAFDIVSTFGVKRHLDALAKKGFIKVESNFSRAIVITELGMREFGGANTQNSSNYVEIPIVGRVAAGLPILALENRDGSLTLDSTLFKNAVNCFALKVRGDSMINAGIFENDLIIVSPQKDANNGDIVVAMVDDEATVKRFRRDKETVTLIPENDNYSPMTFNKKDFLSIIGKIIGVFRRYN